jgi:hypothetical protein
MAVREQGSSRPACSAQSAPRFRAAGREPKENRAGSDSPHGAQEVWHADTDQWAVPSRCLPLLGAVIRGDDSGTAVWSSPEPWLSRKSRVIRASRLVEDVNRKARTLLAVG